MVEVTDLWPSRAFPIGQQTIALANMLAHFCPDTLWTQASETAPNKSQCHKMS